MNTTTSNPSDVNPSKAFILELKKKIDAINESGKATFIGITYTAKGTGETARHVLNLSVSYMNAVRKALAELDTLSREGLSGLEIEALNNVIASYKNTLDKAELGEKNDAYTKKDVYLDICPGLKMSLNDYSLEIRAMSVSKKVLVKGKEKKTSSSPLVIAQDKFKENLSVSKYRSFCLDVGCLDSIRIGGAELEVE